jgi:DNA-binding XRE family transcriptional regulator
MARPKPTEDDLMAREARIVEWRKFRKDHLFTQVKLAEVLGLCRRTVQLIEKGKVTPLPSTQRLFNALKVKHQHEEAA